MSEISLEIDGKQVKIKGLADAKSMEGLIKAVSDLSKVTQLASKATLAAAKDKKAEAKDRRSYDDIFDTADDAASKLARSLRGSTYNLKMFSSSVFKTNTSLSDVAGSFEFAKNGAMDFASIGSKAVMGLYKSIAFFGKKVPYVGLAFDGLEKGGSMLMGGFSMITKVLGPLGTVLTAIGGIAGTVIGSLIAAITDTQKAFQKLSAVGASYGNSLLELRRAAVDANLYFDEFVELIANNSELLSRFGATVTDGAKAFTSLAKDFRKSPFGEQLRNMGYTTQDVNDSLVTYMETQKNNMFFETMSKEEQIKQAGELTMELDAISKLYGIERKALQDKLKREKLAGGVEAAILKEEMKGNTTIRASYAALSTQLNAISPDMAKMLGDLVQANVPLDEAMKQVAGTFPEATRAVGEMAQGLKDGKIDFTNEVAGMVVSLDKGRKANLDVASAASQSASGALGAIARVTGESGPALAKYGKILNDTTLSEKEKQDQIAAAMKKAKDEQNSKDTLTSATQKLEEAFRTMYNTIWNAFLKSPIFDQLSEQVGNFISVLTAQGGNLAESIGKVIQTIMGWAEKLLTSSGQEELKIRLENILLDLEIGFKKLINKLTPVGNFFSEESIKALEKQKDTNAKMADVLAQAHTAELKRKQEEAKITNALTDEQKKQLDKLKTADVQEVQAIQSQDWYKKYQDNLSKLTSQIGPDPKIDEAKKAYAEQIKKVEDEKIAIAKKEENTTTGMIEGAVAGAAAGALVGSIVPVVGTVIGAAVGGIAGGLLGRQIGKNAETFEQPAYDESFGGIIKPKEAPAAPEPPKPPPAAPEIPKPPAMPQVSQAVQQRAESLTVTGAVGPNVVLKPIPADPALIETLERGNKVAQLNYEAATRQNELLEKSIEESRRTGKNLQSAFENNT